MEYKYPTNVEAVILDWAGTTVDFGSFAPTQIFVDAFQSVGLAISLAEARGPMGVAKIDHIRAICAEPDVSKRWQKQFGSSPTENDVERIYREFLPLQIAKIGEYSALIPGTLETVQWLHTHKIKIGSCSGYPRVAMQCVTELAAAAGYVPDCWVASDDVPKGRPLPAQALKNVVDLGIQDVAACVKVDDTAPGLLEGRRAGMWTVACLASSNNMGLTYDEWNQLSSDEQGAAVAKVRKLFEPCGAHYFIDTIADLPTVLHQISIRLSQGDRP